MQCRPYIFFHPSPLRSYLHSYTPGRKYLSHKKLTRVAYSNTDCGLSHATEDGLKMKLKERAGPEKAAEVDAMVFGTIGR